MTHRHPQRARPGAGCSDDDVVSARPQEAQARCRAFQLAEAEPMDSVGTIYVVAADIFREGGALYADHRLYTEHYPINLHARRMGRQVVALTTAVARHANLPLYGESFHDNVFTGAEVAADGEAALSKAEQGTLEATVTRCYCDELGRLPDPGGLLSMTQRLHAGKTDERALRKGLGESAEGRARRSRLLAEEGDLVLAFHVGCSGQGGTRQRRRRRRRGVAEAGRDGRLNEGFDVFVGCRAAACEWLRRVNERENELRACLMVPHASPLACERRADSNDPPGMLACEVAPGSRKCREDGERPWKIDLVLEKRVLVQPVEAPRPGNRPLSQPSGGPARTQTAAARNQDLVQSAPQGAGRAWDMESLETVFADVPRYRWEARPIRA